MWTAILKALPAIASLFKGVIGLFSSMKNNRRKKKAVEHKDQINIVTTKIENAVTDAERRDLINQLNKL